MKKNLFYLVAVFFTSALLLTSCQKDTDVEPKEPDYTTTSINTNIPRIVENNKGGINVFVNVTDQNGKVIKDLNNNNFKFEMITSDGKTKTLNATGPGQLPSLIITALTMDYSGSMYDDSVSVPAMENAISTFINLKNPYDQIELIKFSKNIQVTVPLTAKKAVLLNGLNDTTFTGKNSTALYAALNQGMSDVTKLANNNPTYLPSLVGFTDGRNNQPPQKPDTLIQTSIVEQVPIYTVGYGITPKPDTTQLKNISGQTGAQFFWSPSTSNMNTVYKHINGQLANTTIIPLPGPQTKGKVTIRVTTTYQCAAGKLTSTTEKDFFY